MKDTKKLVKNKWQKAMRNELAPLEPYLRGCVNSDEALVQSAACGLITAGGKRIRPALALLAARLWGGNTEYMLPLLAALELIHTGSLVHDDIIDKASLRRGQPTVNFVHGDVAALYVGDYLIGRALELVAVYENERVNESLNRTVMQMCLGELKQGRDFFRFEQGARDYLLRIRCKTALLFAGSCECGAVLAGASDEGVDALWRWGYNVGMAFQIIDDILDLCADEAELGKPVGNDLRQGNISLPVLYTLRGEHADELRGLLLRLQVGDTAALTAALDLVRALGGLQFAADCAKKFLRRAEACLVFLPKGRESRLLREVMTDFESQLGELTARFA